MWHHVLHTGQRLQGGKKLPHRDDVSIQVLGVMERKVVSLSFWQDVEEGGEGVPLGLCCCCLRESLPP